MPVLIALLLGVTPPDPSPLRSAVEQCDRGAVAELVRAEPRRRAEFAAAIYREQRAVATDRAGVLTAAAGTSPAGATNLAAARTALDARQQQLDDARAVERAWRDFVEEERADFLASCTAKKRDHDK